MKPIKNLEADKAAAKRAAGDDPKKQAAAARKVEAEVRSRARNILPFCLNDSEREECSTRMQTARVHGMVSSGLYSSHAWTAFKRPSACKTHDGVLLSGPFGIYAIQDMLQKYSRRAVSMLFEALGRLWAKSFKRSQLKHLELLVQRALIQVHIYMPATNDIVMHLMHHIASGISVNGPPWALAMWAFERCWGIYIRQNFGTKHPHISIMRNYINQQLSETVISGFADREAEERVCILPLINTVLYYSACV